MKHRRKIDWWYLLALVAYLCTVVSWPIYMFVKYVR